MAPIHAIHAHRIGLLEWNTLKRPPQRQEQACERHGEAREAKETKLVETALNNISESFSMEGT